MVIILVACHCGIATHCMYMVAENCLKDDRSSEDYRSLEGNFPLVE